MCEPLATRQTRPPPLPLGRHLHAFLAPVLGAQSLHTFSCRASAFRVRIDLRAFGKTGLCYTPVAGEGSAPHPMNAPTSSTPLFKVRGSSIQGKGVFAARLIRKGTRIVEYTGERISHEEAEARYDDRSMSRHHTFLFTVDDETCIDGNDKANVARFINHSCDPNCEALDMRNRIFIYAKRAIQPGEELSYDYGYDLDISLRMAKKYYPCRCGAATCRGTIISGVSEPKKPAPKKAKKAAPKKAKKTAK